jgi:hypothetical protein
VPTVYLLRVLNGGHASLCPPYTAQHTAAGTPPQIRAVPLTFPKDVPRPKRAACYIFTRSTRSALERAQISLSFMSHPATFSIARDPLPDHEQKQAALSYLNEAWAEARHDGVDGDCLAQASLFTALAELVSTYGEDAVSKFVENLPTRVRNGEFSLSLAKQ